MPHTHADRSPAGKRSPAYAFTFYALPPGAPAGCASVIAPYGACGGVHAHCLTTKDCGEAPLAGACCHAGYACAATTAGAKLRCLPSASPSPSPLPALPLPSPAPGQPAEPSPSPSPAATGEDVGAPNAGGVVVDDVAESLPVVLETKATYTMPRPVDAGHASGAPGTVTVMRLTTPAGLQSNASRLTLTLAGSWRAANGSAIDTRRGDVAVVMPPAPGGGARHPLVATKASHFSDADGADGDFTYSVNWYNLTVLPRAAPLLVQAVTRGGRFVKLSVKVELVWISALQAGSEGSSSGASGGGSRPSGSGAPPADESSTVVATPTPIHFNETGLGAAAEGGGANLTFFKLLNFSVPPAFNPSGNRVELWARGEWRADTGAAAPLGIVGIAQNGSLLAYSVASHYIDHAGASANFSYGTSFGNVSLAPGSSAELWAGMRGGHFRALSASASLSWSAAPPAVPPAPIGDAAALAPAIEQAAKVAMQAPRTLAGSKAAGAAPILNFTAPPNFNPDQNMVEMWLTGEWEGGANATGPPAGVAPPIGGVALMRNGQVLAYTFPSDEASTKGSFFYGAVWQNVGLPADGGVVEVWAGVQVRRAGKAKGAGRGIRGGSGGLRDAQLRGLHQTGSLSTRRRHVC